MKINDHFHQIIQQENNLDNQTAVWIGTDRSIGLSKPNETLSSRNLVTSESNPWTKDSQI